MISAIKSTYGPKNGVISTTPTMLKKIWKYAALLAIVVVPIEARNAVIVVPMFWPRTSATAVW